MTEMNEIIRLVTEYVVLPLAAALGWLFQRVFRLESHFSFLEKRMVSIENDNSKKLENIEKTLSRIDQKIDAHQAQNTASNEKLWQHINERKK